jgi:hypothetical protein
LIGVVSFAATNDAFSNQSFSHHTIENTLLSLDSHSLPHLSSATCQVKVSQGIWREFVLEIAFFSLLLFSLTGTGARGGLFGAGGRFKGGTDPIMEKFNESIGFDKRYV